VSLLPGRDFANKSSGRHCSQDLGVWLGGAGEERRGRPWMVVGLARDGGDADSR
jgi:hypothetical protein